MRKIFLTGLRGSGKSTVGKELATLLDCPFIDLDEYLTKREGKTIAELVQESGWQVFRQLEKTCLKEACQTLNNGGVIATGGGIVLDAENRAFMQENGRVFWLAVQPEILEKRLRDNPNEGQRPAFSQKSLLKEMQDLSWDRLPHYQSSAHCIVDGERQSGEICELLLTIINEN